MMMLILMLMIFVILMILMILIKMIKMMQTMKTTMMNMVNKMTMMMTMNSGTPTTSFARPLAEATLAQAFRPRCVICREITTKQTKAHK